MWSFDNLFKAESPILPRRGVHLDLKGLPPTSGRLLELLDVFAAARYNVVLVEWEDSFPWTVDKRFRSPTAYSPETIDQFQKEAADLDIEIIPLVQCLGHMGTPLNVPGYEKLREVADDPSGLNPLASGARELVQDMVDDVLNLMPDVNYFHLGGDEARTLGKHPDTRAYIEEHGKGDLYMQHVEPILDNLNERAIRPILWHDMMVEWGDDALESLSEKADLLTWGYSGHPDDSENHYNTKYIQRFYDHGFNLWGGTAYKGADGHNVDRPDLQKREENALAWTEVAEKYAYTGVIATAWSRYSTDNIQCEPIDASLDSLINVGVIMHDGQPPEGGIEACVSALEELDEKERFRSCKAAMEDLAEIRISGWILTQKLREIFVLSQNDSRRRGARINTWEKYFHEVLEEADEVAERVRKRFAGLVESVWVEEYLDTRLVPLHEEGAFLGLEMAHHAI